jgi:predicted Na+-dependent transporter
MSQQKLMTLLQRLSLRMISLLSARGSAESAKQSMDNLMTAAIIVLVICSLWLGYLLGVSHG